MSDDTPTKVVSLAAYRKQRQEQNGRPLPKDRSLVLADVEHDRFIFDDEPIPESHFPEPRA